MSGVFDRLRSSKPSQPPPRILKNEPNRTQDEAIQKPRFQGGNGVLSHHVPSAACAPITKRTHCAAFLAALLLLSCIAVGGTWKARDVAAKSDWATGDDAAKSNLKLVPTRGAGRESCTIIDTTGGDRAATLAFTIPLDAVGGTWCDDPQISRTIEAGKNYSNLSDGAGGVDNSASLYPLAVVVRGETATVLACPPDVPRMVRFVYDATAKELRAEFDFGLSPIPQNFPSRADATIITYEVPAQWAFRRAIAKYQEMFPAVFARRVKHAGLWLPFGETAAIEHAEDFGFGFHEIADSQVAGNSTRVTDDDAKLNCGSYLYVEPQTYWQWHKGEGRGSYEQRLAQLEADAKAGDGFSRGTIVSGIIREGGKRDLYEEPVAYTPQLPWGNNPDPAIPDDAARGYLSKANFEFNRLEPLLGWHGKPTLGVDGVYVDSMEGWGEILNFNRDHWRVTSHPLTFHPWNHKVCLLNFWGTYAWVKEMSTRLRKKDMILLGNDAFYRRWQLAPWVDVPGREYKWLDDAGKFAQVPDERYLYFRSMSGRKPYLMLMNNGYEDGSIMEKYFQRSTFWAVYPSMYFGHTSANEVWYWSNPQWYNRDRPLFKKYVPMIRKLDAAGWQPVPLASASPAFIRIERFGSFDRGDLAFTVHNPELQVRDVTIQLDRAALGLPESLKASEWISLLPVELASQQAQVSLRLTLPADGYAVVELVRN